ncbi:transketolase family protein, partial [Candidatus Bathyarchaeota archaeon]|nr:transketolase family protein [Candidatus Bathyarchaeota archaeon]
DQIRISIAYMNLNVKIGGTHGGISVGADGATHQALEEITLMRMLPNMSIVVPCDSIEARKATLEAARIGGPVYIRLGRNPAAIITNEKDPFKIGKANLLKEGKDVTIAATGILMSKVLKASKILERDKIDVQVLNFHTIKPLDTEAINNSARETGAIVTVEDSSVIGGLGGSITEILSENYPIPIHRIGVRDVFGQTGNMEELATEYNMNITDIIKAAKNVIKKKRK